MEKIKSELMAQKASASEAESIVPDRKGYYAIHLVDPDGFEPWISGYVSEHKVIYLGIATKSLRERLTKQELRHKKAATFFRSLGALLGYRPIPGSLKGRANQSNYKFSPEDTVLIIEWINTNLAISWSADDKPLKSVEKRLIGSLKPIINIDHNPSPLPKLPKLRSECRAIACGEQRN